MSRHRLLAHGQAAGVRPVHFTKGCCDRHAHGRAVALAAVGTQYFGHEAASGEGFSSNWVNAIRVMRSNHPMATVMLTEEELTRLIVERDGLRSEVRTLETEISLLEERFKAHLRKLFDASSEARGTEQKDLFFNEAEALVPADTPVAEEATQDIEVPANTRKKPGHKPLDLNQPRDIVRHELPDADRVCAHDGSALVEIGVQISEQLDTIPPQVRVIQHQQVMYTCPCCDQGIKVTPAPAPPPC